MTREKYEMKEIWYILNQCKTKNYLMYKKITRYKLDIN